MSHCFSEISDGGKKECAHSHPSGLTPFRLEWAAHPARASAKPLTCPPNRQPSLHARGPGPSLPPPGWSRPPPRSLAKDPAYRKGEGGQLCAEQPGPAEQLCTKQIVMGRHSVSLGCGAAWSGGQRGGLGLPLPAPTCCRTESHLTLLGPSGRTRSTVLPAFVKRSEA